MLGTIHGDLRWIFALVALLGIARAVYGLYRGSAYSHLDARLAITYSMLLDLQALYGIGLILYLALVKFTLETTVNWIDWHPVWMLAAVAVGHLGARWKNTPDRTRFQVQLAIYTASLVLIAIGVLASPLKSWT
jgi:hypothetical protein